MRAGSTRNCATFHATSMSPVEAGHDITLTVTIRHSLEGIPRARTVNTCTLKNEVRMGT